MLTLSPLGEKIFLDRYALKHPNGTVPQGARVLFTDPVSGQKEVGTVIDASDPWAIAVEGPGGASHRFRREEMDYPQETISQTMERVARAAAGVNVDLYSRFLDVLGTRFVPAGRILESLGSGQETTGVNCFVLPCPHDSRGGLFSSLAQMAELMCKGGGVGINYSSLRPSNAYVAGVNGRSSGAVSWMELFSFVTNLIIQGGSRRGAQMAMMSIWHPDIQQFINLKRDNLRATGCNMSVIVSDDFMRAVENNEGWTLRFPDTTHEAYNEEWDGDLHRWQEQLGLPVVVWDRVEARGLWEQIISSAHACAEPGLWFQDTANNARVSGGRLVSTNPCGEQGLPPYGVCNLGHLYLPAFLEGCRWLGDLRTKLNKTLLGESVRAAVRFLDRVVDVTKYPLQETAQRQAMERRIGLGTLGLGEYLIRAGVRYGSQDALYACREMYQLIAYHAYDESAQMASEAGPAPSWDPDQFSRSTFGQRLEKAYPELGDKVRRLGLRNVCLLTQAPCGTVGTMVGTSTGIEPFYLLEWDSQTRLGRNRDRARVVDDYRAVVPDGPLPDYFVTSADLAPMEHVKMQAAIQEWTDASISKTINMPESATIDDVAEVYEGLYRLGCKGGTVYRDKSRSVQVLTAVEEPRPDNRTREIPRVRPSVTASSNTPGGKVHVHLTLDEAGNPLEVFCDSGRSGSEIRALMEALGRLASLVLRVDDTMGPQERFTEVVSQLNGIGGMYSIGMGPNRVLSMADGVAKALWDAWASLTPQAIPEAPPTPGLDLCPSCQNMTLQRASGCMACTACPYSQC